MAEKTFGATINAVSCSQIDVQSAIDASVSGDTVSVPAGDCTWSSEVTIPDSKGITIEANSSTISGRLVFNQNYDTSTRITGFNFISGNAVYVAGIKTSAPFRVDHNTFTVTEGSSILLEVEGNAPGLVDNNSFNAPTNSEMIHNYGMGAVDASGWNDDIIPGSADAVYIEDNIFTNNDPSFWYGRPRLFLGELFSPVILWRKNCL